MDRHEHANLVKIKYVILFQRVLSYVLRYIFKKKVFAWCTFLAGDFIDLAMGAPFVGVS